MKIYRGSAAGSNGPHVVEVWEDDQLVGPLQHHVKHSPTGMSWGYGGSGAADLARSLLIDALDDARCPTCDGEGRVPLAAVMDRETHEVIDWVPAVQFTDGTLDVDTPHAPSDKHAMCLDCWGEKTAAPVNANYQQFKAAYVASWPQDGCWEITEPEIRAFIATVSA